MIHGGSIIHKKIRLEVGVMLHVRPPNFEKVHFGIPRMTQIPIGIPGFMGPRAYEGSKPALTLEFPGGPRTYIGCYFGIIWRGALAKEFPGSDPP